MLDTPLPAHRVIAYQSVVAHLFHFGHVAIRQRRSESQASIERFLPVQRVRRVDVDGHHVLLERLVWLPVNPSEFSVAVKIPASHLSAVRNRDPADPGVAHELPVLVKDRLVVERGVVKDKGAPSLIHERPVTKPPPEVPQCLVVLRDRLALAVLDGALNAVNLDRALGGGLHVRDLLDRALGGGLHVRDLHARVVKHHIVVAALPGVAAGAVEVLDACDAEAVEVLGRGLVGAELLGKRLVDFLAAHVLGSDRLVRDFPDDRVRQSRRGRLVQRLALGVQAVNFRLHSLGERPLDLLRLFGQRLVPQQVLAFFGDLDLVEGTVVLNQTHPTRPVSLKVLRYFSFPIYIGRIVRPAEVSRFKNFGFNRPLKSTGVSCRTDPVKYPAPCHALDGATTKLARINQVPVLSFNFYRNLS